MNNTFTVLERFVPEAIELIATRYQILRQVLNRQPVGRRQLCKELGYTERLIRNEIDLLKSRGVILISAAGINLTPYGEELLRDIDEIAPALYNTQTLAKKVKQMFNLLEVIIVPGDSWQDEMVKRDLGRAAARYLEKLLCPGRVIAVTGGTTLAEMARAMPEGHYGSGVLVVPARGGLGEEMEQQAGTIAARIAQASGAQYRLLHIPDNMEESTAKILEKDIHISQVVSKIKGCDILIHGIGTALEMANRRGLSSGEMILLNKNQAVGEALRYYLDKRGNIIYEVPGIGLEMNDMKNIGHIIAVAGGSHKAQAIQAVLNNRTRHVLITDQGAAEQLIENNHGKEGLYDS